MRKLFYGFLLVALTNNVFSQVKFYKHSGMDFIYSFIDYTSNPMSVNNKPRFSFFLHFGEYWNLDLNDNIGFFSGVSLNNIGFIAVNEAIDMQKRFRSYGLGVPLAMKIGSFKNKFYMYGGGEYQCLFHYKEKTYYQGDKIKSTDWFSSKTPLFLPSIFVGIQFPQKVNLKFQYTLSNFLNTDEFIPEMNRNASFGIPSGHLFWISLAFTDFERILKKDKDKEERYVLNTKY